MVQIQQRFLIVCAAALPALALLAVPCQAKKFFDDDPLLKDPAPVAVSTAEPRKISDIYDFLYQSFGKYPQEGPSLAVNTLGEVPDSAWYTNRHVSRRMSVAELVRGPGGHRPPDSSGKWRIISAKTDGVTPGFMIEDATGARYLLKLDPPRNPELASAADVIGSKFFYALGYNTPENYIVRFRRDQLEFDAGAKFRIHGRERPLTNYSLERMFQGQAVDGEGRYRALASRLIEGKLLGQFRYYGTRADDPNDIVPHQRRRDLRGLFVFCAWLNHDDSRDINTVDSLVEESGVRYIKHYLIDFGAILGSNTYRSDSGRNGFEYMWDPMPASLRFLTLGLYVPRWARSARYSNLPSVGRLESKLFEPDEWKPEYPNIAFLNRTPEDEFWAARQVMAFRDDEIRAIVKTGEYSDPAAEEWIARCLIERRDKIGRAYFSKVLPLDGFRIEGGRLRFLDLAQEYGFSGSRQYSVAWSVFDNVRLQHAPIPGASGAMLPDEILKSGDGYFGATISGTNGSQTIVVSLRKRGDAISIVGIDRTW
jgi:hypothetical protein